jgi:hypothetical protein
LATIKQVVAENLRRLCDLDGRSTAFLCKEMGIPRSQFDRYLAADNLPTEGTAKTIAAFFKVREIDIFQIGFRARSRISPTHFQEALDSLMHYPAPRLPVGQYFAFSRVQSSANDIMCSVIAVRKSEDNLVFMRLTGFSGHRLASNAYFRGRHSGVVVERANWLYFSGVNTVADYEPTMMMVRWISSDETLLPGKWFVTSERGPGSFDVVIKRAPRDLPLKKAVRMARMYPPTAEHIGEEVLRLLHNPE